MKLLRHSTERLDCDFGIRFRYFIDILLSIGFVVLDLQK